MSKKLPSDKINITKNVLFSLSLAPTHHSFAFNSRYLYKVRLSKTMMRGIFHFRFCLIFIKVYHFVNAKHGLFDFKTS